MTNAIATHPWSEQALFGKAQIFVDEMESRSPDEWQFGFWSALALEMLARAALAHISPTLLADTKTWRNLMHALGHAPTTMKYSPTSITTIEVFARLNELVPDFTQEIAGFCTKHADRRNSEIHSGELVFSSLGTSAWLPRFYLTCKILLESMGKNLSDFVSDAKTADEMIAALEDAAAKAVNKDISAHSQVWENKKEDERETARTQAITWATRQAGHRVVCPACSSQALLQGSAQGAVTTSVDEDEVVQRQPMLPSSFECIACGLRISGFSKLSASGLGDLFIAKSAHTAAEFFGLYTEDDLDDARSEGSHLYEDDFNEF